MKEQIENIMTEIHPDVDFSAENGLVDHGILDSFDIISIVTEIDAQCGILIPAEELIPENFNSMDAIVKLVTRLSGF